MRQFLFSLIKLIYFISLRARAMSMHGVAKWLTAAGVMRFACFSAAPALPPSRLLKFHLL
jgi:hypothetical protein